MIKNLDIVTSEHLSNCVINVTNIDKKYKISEVFSTDLIFASDSQKNGLTENIKVSFWNF